MANQYPIHNGYLIYLAKSKDNSLRLEYLKYEVSHLDLDAQFERQIESCKSFLSDQYSLTCILRQANKYAQDEYLKNLLYLPSKAFCRDLSAPYQELDSFRRFQLTFKKIIKSIEMNKTSGMGYKMAAREVGRWILHRLRGTLNDRARGYDLELAYKKASEINDLVTHSHRRIGWSMPIYKYNKHFSIQIKTNFGYGSSSYFNVIIHYKENKLVCFSDWVTYDLSLFYEHMWYSLDLMLTDESWEEAMIFTQDAYNLSITDERAFLKKYLIDELESLVMGLSELLNPNLLKDNSHLKVYDFFQKDTRYQFDRRKYQILEFQCEKIVGSLYFLELIEKYKQHSDVEHFIKSIIRFNADFKPQINDYLDKCLKPDILSTENQIELLKGELSKLEDEREEINNLRKQYIEDQEKKRPNEFRKTLNDEYNRLHPEYQKLNDEIKELKNDLEKEKSNLHDLNTSRDKINKYREIQIELMEKHTASS